MMKSISTLRWPPRVGADASGLKGSTDGAARQSDRRAAGKVRWTLVVTTEDSRRAGRTRPALSQRPRSPR
jgi:hypothetical protein